MCILLVLTEPFKFLPKFCLAAIVISSVTNLVDYKECRHLWHVKKPDCLLWVLAFFGTLFLGVQNGLLGAIVASLVIVIYESVRPQISVLWRLPETPIYRNIKQESLGQFIPVPPPPHPPKSIRPRLVSSLSIQSRAIASNPSARPIPLHPCPYHLHSI